MAKKNGTGEIFQTSPLMILEACRMAGEGMDAKTIKSALERKKKSFSTSFVVSSLKYMAKAGQVDERINIISNAILMRPVLRMKNGRITLGRIYFGTQQNSWKNYIETELRFSHNIDKSLLFVTYVGMSQKDLDYINYEIEKRVKFERIIFQQASPVIALNCGPGTFGLLYKKIEE